MSSSNAFSEGASIGCAASDAGRALGAAQAIAERLAGGGSVQPGLF